MKIIDSWCLDCHSKISLLIVSYYFFAFLKQKKNLSQNYSKQALRNHFMSVTIIFAYPNLYPKSKISLVFIIHRDSEPESFTSRVKQVTTFCRHLRTRNSLLMIYTIRYRHTPIHDRNDRYCLYMNDYT